MEISNVMPKYERAKKGVVMGSVVGAAVAAGQYGLCNANYSGMKDASFAEKRARIEVLSRFLSADGVDLQKTTVSKFIKKAKKTAATSGLAKCAVFFASVGALIGGVVDVVKNKAEKKDV